MRCGRCRRHTQARGSDGGAAAVGGSSSASSRSELRLLRQHTDLLKQHLQVTKDLLSAKSKEEECEYQWAVAKAKVAQLELSECTLRGNARASAVARALKARYVADGGSSALCPKTLLSSSALRSLRN